MKRKTLRKLLSYFTVMSLLMTISVTGNSVKADEIAESKEETSIEEKDDEKEIKEKDYARAFQLSMYFYDANKCGDVEGNTRLSWRGNCHQEDKKIPLKTKTDENPYGTNMSEEFIEANKAALDPDGDGTVDLSGGYHDAGDHVKFGLPQSYTGSTLGWGYYEFRDSYVKIGEQDHIESILRWFNDYFMRCTFRDKNGDVVAFAYQIGDGTTDHSYWGAPELQTTPRPAFFATSETPASDQCAGAAASLAVNYLNFMKTDPEYAEKCLDTAKALYKFAVANRGIGFSGGFYGSAYDEDEMSWAAIWLYYATGEMKYITDITAVDSTGYYTGYMKKIIDTTDSSWQNIWVHSWDVVWGGVFAKLAPVSNSLEHLYFFRWNVEYWAGIKHENPNDKTFLKPTPAGFRVVNTWGSCRYNAAAQLTALTYNKYYGSKEAVEWCKNQMDYILGDNPEHRCYEVGYDETSAKYPHHRAAHGSDTNSMLDPVECKHTLWGALVGGPDNNDVHKDVRTDFVYNEVAVDYNAGFVGALAGLYDIYGEGKKAQPDYRDSQKDVRPYYASTKLEQENSERTQVTVKVTNDTSCPPRLESNMKARYYFNISELKEAGRSIEDIKVEVMYDQSKTLDEKGCKVSEPYVYDEKAGIYYVELDWTGNSFHGSREIQFALIAGQDSNWKSHWDPFNDYSRSNVTKEMAINENVPVYLGDELVYGKNPSKGAEVTIEAPEFLDCAKDISSVNIKANVVKNDDEVDHVEFYADGEKIGETSKEPYGVSYTPVDENRTGDYDKVIKLTAKVVLNSGHVVESKVAELKVLFEVPIPEVIKITSPQEGTIFDISKNSSFKINVESTGTDYKIDKVEVFADGEKIGESKGDSYEIEYTPKEGKSGISNVELTAKATLADGRVYSTNAVIVKVKYKNKENLSLAVEGNTTDFMTNTIRRKFIITNNGEEAIDLNNVRMRYYFTDDHNMVQKFFCDSASMNLNSAPWYVNLEKNISGNFIKMINAVDDADKYLEISLNGLKTMLGRGDSASIEFRIVNSNWQNFNQENDYSSDSEKNIVILYNDSVINGLEP